MATRTFSLISSSFYCVYFCIADSGGASWFYRFKAETFSCSDYDKWRETVKTIIFHNCGKNKINLYRSYFWGLSDCDRRAPLTSGSLKLRRFCQKRKQNQKISTTKNNLSQSNSVSFHLDLENKNHQSPSIPNIKIRYSKIITSWNFDYNRKIVCLIDIIFRRLISKFTRAGQRQVQKWKNQTETSNLISISIAHSYRKILWRYHYHASANTVLYKKWDDVVIYFIYI